VEKTLKVTDRKRRKKEIKMQRQRTAQEKNYGGLEKKGQD